MALIIPVLIGFAGLAVDGSNIYFQTQRMQISADAAAIGGAWKLASNAGHNVVDVEIREFAFANYADEVTWEYINNNRGACGDRTGIPGLFCAHFYGHRVFTVTAESDAQYEIVTGASGLFPFTITCNCGDGEGQVILVKRKRVVTILHPQSRQPRTEWHIAQFGEQSNSLTIKIPLWNYLFRAEWQYLVV